jgi:transglutaminase-like putative cysteine protease
LQRSEPLKIGEKWKRIRIVHDTAYHYREPVTFGTHRVMLRPREGHDVHIAAARLVVEPRAEVRWKRDIYGNAIAIQQFAEPAATLRVLSEVDIDLFEGVPFECLVEPGQSWINLKRPSRRRRRRGGRWRFASR